MKSKYCFHAIKQTELSPPKVNSPASNRMCYHAKSIFASSRNHSVFIDANNHKRPTVMDVSNEYFMYLLIIKLGAILCQKNMSFSSLVLNKV